jgi:hypothetical protein
MNLVVNTYQPKQYKTQGGKPSVSGLLCPNPTR